MLLPRGIASISTKLKPLRPGQTSRPGVNTDLLFNFGLDSIGNIAVIVD